MTNATDSDADIAAVLRGLGVSESLVDESTRLLAKIREELIERAGPTSVRADEDAPPMSVPEFMTLSLHERVKGILSKRIRFQAGAAAMDRNAALGSMLGDAVRKARREHELRLARHMQRSILPRDVEVTGLDIAAEMIPSAEIGGDYYEVLVVPNGCFLAIGDVSGHGMSAGLVMFMLQSITATVVRTHPEATPRRLVSMINDILVESLRTRLGQDDHVTFTLLRYHDDGRVTYAGAHEHILVFRAAHDQVELLPTPGTWLGLRPGIEAVTEDSSFELLPGDVVLLFTDGVTEARDATGAHFDIDRLTEAFREVATRPPSEVRDHVLARVRAWMCEQDDDLTLMVMRFKATA